MPNIDLCVYYQVSHQVKLQPMRMRAAPLCWFLTLCVAFVSSGELIQLNMASLDAVLHGGDLGRTGGGPQDLRWGRPMHLRPTPNILRSTVIGCEAK